MFATQIPFRDGCALLYVNGETSYDALALGNHEFVSNDKALLDEMFVGILCLTYAASSFTQLTPLLVHRHRFCQQQQW
jgi:hypothetical protein